MSVAIGDVSGSGVGDGVATDTMTGRGAGFGFGVTVTLGAPLHARKSLKGYLFASIEGKKGILPHKNLTDVE